jgi:hypothetical protein
MTRSDVMASSRPRTPCAASTSNRRGSSGFLRGLSALPAVLLLALALVVPGTAAAEATSGYSQEPTKPTTTPSTGTSPSEGTKKTTTTTPAKEPEPAVTSTTPTTSEKATKLPFTGFDLRWDIGFGVLLMGAGLSIVAMQRRQRGR